MIGCLCAKEIAEAKRRRGDNKYIWMETQASSSLPSQRWLCERARGAVRERIMTITQGEVIMLFPRDLLFALKASTVSSNDVRAETIQSHGKRDSRIILKVLEAAQVEWCIDLCVT